MRAIAIIDPFFGERSFRGAFFAAALLAVPALLATPAPAANQGVIAVVNDKAITTFDVDQRIKMTTVIGSGRKLTRKQALDELIDDVLKHAEAKRLNALLGDDQVDKAIERLAKGSGMSIDGLNGKLKSLGISMKALRAQLTTSLSFNRVLVSKYQLKAAVEPAAVDKKLASLKRDPRLKPVAVFELIEVVLPVEKSEDAMANQLLMARVVEARQMQQRFAGCGKTRDAAEGIFNVKISKVVEAPVENLPKGLRSALETAGPGKLVGPMRAPNGVQLIAFCGKRTVSPPAPSREQVERLMVDEMYGTYEEKYLKDLRRTALIDYKDASANQGSTQ
jgi:peptidyl-prolyl cis-trans isomerase SurA